MPMVISQAAGFSRVCDSQQIFEEVCSKCHKIGNQGYDVGPDLLSVLNRPESQLMTDILMPNLNKAWPTCWPT